MSDICNNNLYIKPLEVCSAKALELIYKKTSDELYRYNSNYIFDKKILNSNNDINSNFRNEITNEYIYKSSNLKKDLCFPIKNDNINNSPYIVNCVIATESPYFTFDKKNKSCSILPNIELHENLHLEYENNNTYLYYKDKKDLEGNYSYSFKNEKAFCENKWYDWIVIPNYHFGNQYEKDSGIYSKEDVRRCYKPCEKGFMPYIDLNGSNICVEKEKVSDGLYLKKLDYSPISLINLIGNSKKDILSELYTLITLFEYNNYTINNNYILKEDTLIKNIDYSNDNNYFNREIDNAYNEISDNIWNNIIDEINFDIENYENNKNILTYKNPYFIEKDDDLLILRSLLNYNILSDAILIHTFIISYKYYIFINNDIFKEENYYKDNVLKIDILKENKYNLFNNLDILLNNKLSNKNNIDKKKYKQRLANILFKSINICYDNKSNFSKNIIRKTKEAIEKLISNINIIEYYYKINRAYKEKINISSIITKNDDFINLLNTLKNIIDNGIEIIFYDKNDFTSFSDNFKFINYKNKENDLLKIKEYINNNILFYRIEDNEIKNPCNTNQIKNDKNTCIDCDKYCKIDKDDNKNTCKTDYKCNIFCPNSCKSKKDENIINKCGKTKTDNDKLNLKSEINTPIEEDISFFSNIQQAIRMAIKLFFAIIIIYIIYICFDIFGETIRSILNTIIYYFTYLYFIIISLFSSNKYSVKHKMAEYVRDNTIYKFEKVNTKVNNF